MLSPLTAHIRIIRPEAKARFPYGNCMHVDDDLQLVLDAGAGGRAFEALHRENIDMIMLSHSHFDHMHGTGLFPRAEIWAGREEEACYSDENAYMDFNGYSIWNFLMPGISRESFTRQFPLPDDVPITTGYHPIQLAGKFKDLMSWDTGHTRVTAIHLPGHTSGHYGFYFENEGILFSGDIDLVSAGPWMGSNTADVDDLDTSIKRIKALSPRLIVPSHRRPQSENLQKQLQDFIDVMWRRQALYMEYLQKPHTIFQLAGYRLIYPDPRMLHEVFWERMTVFNHLRYSLRHGLVSEISPGLYQRV